MLPVRPARRYFSVDGSSSVMAFTISAFWARTVSEEMTIPFFLR